jgi:hypothetical protein
MTPPEITGRRPADGRPARRFRNRLRLHAPPAPKKRRGKSVAEFCETWGISLSTFENWQRRGVGPRVVQPAGPGGRRLITDEEETRWGEQALAAD